MRRYIPVLFAAMMLCSCAGPNDHAPEPPRPLPHVEQPQPAPWEHCLYTRDPSGCMGRVGSSPY